MGEFGRPPSQRDQASRFEAGKVAAGINKQLRKGGSIRPDGLKILAVTGTRPFAPPPSSKSPAIFRRSGSR